MIRLCYEYFAAIQAKDSPFPAEAVFMSLLLVQHKAIVGLTAEAEDLLVQKDARLDI